MFIYAWKDEKEREREEIRRLGAAYDERVRECERECVRVRANGEWKEERTVVCKRPKK